MDHLQWYATTPKLARKMYRKFRHFPIRRLLEPEAGRGDLLIHLEEHISKGRVDCIELDLERQAILRAHGFKVIDADFLEFEGRGAMYSHILMNPPFANGVDHVFKAWDLLFNGEICACLNAASIENPNSAKKKLLVKLIEDHGSVEYVDAAFVDPDARRKTKVRVAIVYLYKKGDILKDLFGELEVEREQKIDVPQDYRNLPALPGTAVQHTVSAFNIAVKTMREAVIAETKADYYASLVGLKLEKESVHKVRPGDEMGELVSKIAERYSALKKSAWNQVLSATEFTAHLSSAARERLYTQFDKICDLEFTLKNIYGLLSGLVEKKAEIQLSMVCDFFDLICRYHSENRVYYMGWKSNSKHRQGSFRIKTTRFILPNATSTFGRGICWEMERKLDDLDKVFALLDGKREVEQSTSRFLNKHFTDLAQGERVSGEYFDFRLFPGRGTLHFFPRRKDLIERMNRLVGQSREWLPEDQTVTDPSFWNQYEKAEMVDRQFRKKMTEKGLREHHIYRGEVDFHALITEAIEAAGLPLPRIGSDEGMALLKARAS